MAKPCAACGKTVYPVEMLKCMDQVWHKSCLRCTECGNVLNINNYKGFEKKPYCQVHYPRLDKFTVIADTPEFQRLSTVSKLVSNVKYHEEFERSRGTRSVSQGNVSINLDKNVDFSSSTLPTPSSYSSTSHLLEMKRGLYGPSTMTSTNGNGTGGPGPGPGNSHHNGAEKEITLPVSAVPEERSHRAIYDYQANDSDEVSFLEGDVILNGKMICDGWMCGTVERTLAFGMLPSNYVEPLQ